MEQQDPRLKQDNKVVLDAFQVVTFVREDPTF